MSTAHSILNSINNALHKYPISVIFHGLFWFFVLSFLSPIAGIVVLFLTAYRIIRRSIFPGGNSTIDVKTCGSDLAVYITGCDSGFGKDIAFELLDRGYTIFAGCLTVDGMWQYDDIPSIIPLQVDVTKESEVNEAVLKISNWLVARESGGKPRFLHAVINNAGIGSIGLIDWLEMKDFRKDMEVNFFGMVQTTKSLLPILKSQACQGSHKISRIINITSMAGLVTGPNGAPYHASKHAAEAFSNCLRAELKGFDLSVTTVNPSFHQTPLVDNLNDVLKRRWEMIDQKKKDEYGEQALKHIKQNHFKMIEMITWDAKNVLDEVACCVETIHPPPQLLIGSDARTTIQLVRQLPVWVNDYLLTKMVYRPLCMRNKK